MSITCISMIQNLPYIMYLKTLVKILLRVMDLNISNKTQNTSKNTRNSYFLKNREINQFAFNIHISNAIRPILSSLRVLIYKTFDHNRHRPFQH